MNRREFTRNIDNIAVEELYVSELRYAVHIMSAVNNGLVEQLQKANAEIDRLKGIDAALNEWFSAIAELEYKEFQKEGFEQLVASRPAIRRNL